MAIKVNKPILIAGVGISFLLWLGESFHQQILEMGQWTLLGIMALGTGVWWWQRQTKETSAFEAVSPLTWETVQQAIAQAIALINSLVKEAPNWDISPLKQQLAQLSSAFDRQDLSIALVGGKNTGKTTLKQLLPHQRIADGLQWIDSDPLFQEEENSLITADLVLFLTTGDLTDSQWQVLQQLHRTHQRSLIIFNKQDQYGQEEKTLILQQLRQRVQSLMPVDDIIPITAISTELKVRQHQGDGSVQEYLETQPPDLGKLVERLQVVVVQDRKALIWGSIWREAKQIQQQGKGILNQVRRDRALPIIEQYQWIAAATAFANPVAALDLLATAAINTQMVVDLSGIYQQKFSLSQGKTVSGTLGKLMMQLGLVELSTYAISSLLKSNTLTYIAGGATQGISAAYLTRLAGLSLIEYFQDQEINSETNNGINFEQLSQKLKQIFEQNQRTVFLPGFVQQAIPHLPSLSL